MAELTDQQRANISAAAKRREWREAKQRAKSEHMRQLARLSAEARARKFEMIRSLEAAAQDPRYEVSGPAQRTLISMGFGEALLKKQPIFDARTVELAGRQKHVDAWKSTGDVQVGIFAQLTEADLKISDELAKRRTARQGVIQSKPDSDDQQPTD